MNDLSENEIQTNCLYCKKLIIVDPEVTKEYLCPSCVPGYQKYLLRLESKCPFFTQGKFVPIEDVQESPCLEIENNLDQLSLYEKQMVPGKKNHILGKGAFGEVSLVQHKESKKLYAMKTITKKKLGDTTEKIEDAIFRLEGEIEIQRRLIHNNIIQLEKYFSDEEFIYILVEYASKGTLFSFIHLKKLLTETQAFYFFTQVSNAIHFLHSNKLIHRDIKPENLLITQDGTIKLCDFGYCAENNEVEGRATFCGTLEYMAPEIVMRKRYNEKADIWSLGILLFEMLSGHAPFQGFKAEDTLNKIIQRKIIFDPAIKEDAKNLITSILDEDPKKRPSIIEIMIHPWVKRMQAEFGIPDNILAANGDNNYIQQNVEKNNADTKFESTEDTNLEEEKEVKEITFRTISEEIPRDILYGYPAFASTLSRIKGNNADLNNYVSMVKMPSKFGKNKIPLSQI